MVATMTGTAAVTPVARTSSAAAKRSNPLMRTTARGRPITAEPAACTAVEPRRHRDLLSTESYPARSVLRLNDVSTAAPRGPLSEFVQSIWLYESEVPAHARDLRLPTGAVDLVVSLRDRSGSPDVVVSGPFTTRSAWIPPTSATRWVWRSGSGAPPRC